ncbi:MAG: general secretion pathway protein GspB [Lentisphaeria bacterium]
MSLISDALNQARDEHTRPKEEQAGEGSGREGGSPNIPSTPSGGPRRSGGNDWMILGIVLCCAILVVALAGAAFYIYIQQRKADEEAAAEKQAENELIEEALPGESAETGAAQDKTAGDTDAPEDKAVTAQPKDTDEEDEKVADANEAGETPKKVSQIKTAPKRIRNQYRVSGIMQGDSGRLAIINSKIVGEGDTVEEAVEVSEIGKDFVILKVDKTKYKISL